MFKTLWQAFVPTAENDYRPYFLRVTTVATLVVIILGLWGSAYIVERALTAKGGFLAAVVSSVLVDLTNFDRADNSLHALSVNPTLIAAAQAKANDMAAKSYFAHTAPTGETPWHWFKEVGYDFTYAGENLAVYFSDSADVERAWMNSPGHRANILSPYFTEIGVATAEGTYQGQATTFVVQEFGAPAVALPPATVGTLASVVVPAAEPIATSTPTVSGEEISVITEDNLTVIHEDPEFIAVKNASTTAGPSAYSPEVQSNVFERLLASPRTTLAHAYALLAVVVLLALIFLVVFEMKFQRPLNILFGVLLILILAILLYLSRSSVVVENAYAAFLL